MAIRSERTIYQLVEAHLRGKTEPITCVELMDIHEIREEALAEFGRSNRDVRTATNKLSDTLGFMWRRGLLTRYPAPRSELSFARYAYTWNEQKIDPSKPIPPPARFSSKFPVGIIEHDDCVEIEFEKFTVFVRPK